VTVTCSKAPNATWPAEGFVVTATATATGVSGCSDSSGVQTVVAVAVPTAVTLAAPQDPGSTIVCPTAASRVLNYTFSTLPAGIGLSNVTLTSSGPSCSVASPTNSESASKEAAFSRACCGCCLLLLHALGISAWAGCMSFACIARLPGTSLYNACTMHVDLAYRLHWRTMPYAQPSNNIILHAPLLLSTELHCRFHFCLVDLGVQSLPAAPSL